MADEFLFFGLKSEQQAMKRDTNEDDTQKETLEMETPTTVLKISYDTSTKLDDDMLRMLRRTRHLHDESVVYMQSNIQFYDTFYRHENDMDIDEDLLAEARSIRRIYKSYPEYLYALYIRDLYLDTIRDKVGSDEMFLVLVRSGGLNCWLPPNPIYSKKADDYELGKDGIIDTSCLFDWNDERLEELLKEELYNRGLTGNTIETSGYVVTDNFTLSNSDLVGDEQGRQRMLPDRSVNLSDLNELQKIFRGWYQDDTNTQSQKSEQSNLEKRAFSFTPERLKEDYYMSFVLDMSKEFRNAIDGVSNEKIEDPNEMVYDDVTNKPMSRREHELRKTVRLMKSAGWTDELKLMKLMGVGTSREHAMLQNRSSKRNKRKKKKSRSYQDNIYGNITEPNKDNLIFSDLDSLKAQMFPD